MWPRRGRNFQIPLGHMNNKIFVVVQSAKSPSLTRTILVVLDKGIIFFSNPVLSTSVSYYTCIRLFTLHVIVCRFHWKGIKASMQLDMQLLHLKFKCSFSWAMSFKNMGVRSLMLLYQNKDWLAPAKQYPPHPPTLFLGHLYHLQ